MSEYSPIVTTLGHLIDVRQVDAVMSQSLDLGSTEGPKKQEIPALLLLLKNGQQLSLQYETLAERQEAFDKFYAAKVRWV